MSCVDRQITASPRTIIATVLSTIRAIAARELALKDFLGRLAVPSVAPHPGP
jgi:hypothetical protein